MIQAVCCERELIDIMCLKTTVSYQCVILSHPPLESLLKQ